MGRMARAFLVSLLAAMVVGGVPERASAHPLVEGAAVFTAQLTVDAPLYAPVAPSCGLGLCPAPWATGYAFTTLTGTPPFCSGVVVEDTMLYAGPCVLRSNGVIEASPHIAPTLGPWCGLSSGFGDVTGNISFWSIPTGTEVVWLTSAGTLVPLVLTMKNPALENPSAPEHPARKVVGGGVVQAVGTTPGTCGLVPPNFQPSTTFQVAGFVTFAAEDVI